MVICDGCPFNVDAPDYSYKNCILDIGYPKRNLIYENYKFKMPSGFCNLKRIELKDGTTYVPEIVE